MGNDAAGVGHANSGSPTDQLTRRHRMTLDEAQLILNVKKGDEIEKILKVRPDLSMVSSFVLDVVLWQNYEYLFKTNSPPPPPEKLISGKQSLHFHSHYLQSKVFCARERLEAELNFREALTQSTAEMKGSSPPSPDPPQSNP